MGGELGEPGENDSEQNNMLIVTRTLSGLIANGVITSPRPQGNGKTVTLDFNHPLAGQELTFELELIEIA